MTPCTCKPVVGQQLRGPFRHLRAWIGYYAEVLRQAKRSRSGLCAHWPLAPVRPCHVFQAPPLGRLPVTA